MFDYQLQNTHTNKVDKVKDLGVIVKTFLSPESNFNQVCTKANRSLGLVSVLQDTFNSLLPRNCCTQPMLGLIWITLLLFGLIIIPY